MKNITKLLGILLLGVLLSGCARQVGTNVSIFHNLPQQTTGVKYAFIPLSYQKNSLEYSTYIGYVKQELAKHNYVLVPKSQANAFVILDYGIDGGQEKLVSSPVYGQTGVSGSTTYTTGSAYGSGSSYGTYNSYGGYGSYSGTSSARVSGSSTSTTTYTPTYGVVGSKTSSHTLYTRKVMLRIVEKRTNKPIYEAKAFSKGSSGQLGTVMPYIIEAIFKEFPGKSGSSKRINVTMD